MDSATVVSAGGGSDEVKMIRVSTRRNWPGASLQIALMMSCALAGRDCCRKKVLGGSKGIVTMKRTDRSGEGAGGGFGCTAMAGTEAAFAADAQGYAEMTVRTRPSSPDLVSRRAERWTSW